MTPPTSDLWAIPGEDTFRATGNPNYGLILAPIIARLADDIQADKRDYEPGGHTNCPNLMRTISEVVRMLSELIAQALMPSEPTRESLAPRFRDNVSDR